MSSTRPTEGQLLTEWARLLLHSFWDAGVEHFVLSPGSRSTPFTWAALQLGTDLGRELDPQGKPPRPPPTCHVVLDERSAAFMALGIARNTGTPALLVCTSGSAVANYFPAVVEARAAGLPLLVLSADRPTELCQVGAPQTFDQLKLFGDQAVGFFDLGLPDARPGALRGLRRAALQAFSQSRGPTAGAVHLNARARKPLEPEPAGPLTPVVDALLASEHAPLPPAELRLSQAAATQLAARITQVSDGVILCGPLAPWQALSADALAELVRLTGYAVWHEATSNVAAHGPSSTRFDTWLRAPAARAALWPKLVLQLGPLPTSGVLLGLLDEAPVERHVLCPFGYQDPPNNAVSVHRVALEPSIRRLCEELSRGTASSARVQIDQHSARPSHELLGAVEACCEDAVRTLFGGAERAGGLGDVSTADASTADASTSNASTGDADILSEASAIASVLEGLPSDCLLTVGNSLVVREVDWFRLEATPRRVLSQRGLNGIDGNLSAAVGAAFTTSGPSAVLLGDLSFLHDLAGLWAARQLRRPFVAIVLNNQGGRIFEMLPLAAQVEPSALEAWTTPHTADLSAAARLYGLHYARSNSRTEVAVALDACFARSEASVLELVVEPSSSVLAQRALWQAAKERISRPGGANNNISRPGGANNNISRPGGANNNNSALTR